MLFTQLNHASCKTYLIGVDVSSIVLVDPVLEHVNDYLTYLKDNNLTLSAVVDTHSHADHISGAAALKDRTDCQYIMHENAPSKCVTWRVKEGDLIEIDKLRMEVIESKGHTNDGISLIWGDNLFTGDALFLDDGGAGRDDLPGGDPAKHWETLQKFNDLPDYLIVYPAHDYRERKPSSLANQKITNPHLKKRTKKEFVAYLNDLRLGPADWMKDVLRANYSCAQDPQAAWIPVDAPSCEVKGTLEVGVNETAVESISVKLLAERIKANNPPLMIDVREPHELKLRIGNIEGVENIPIGQLISHLDLLSHVKDEEIVLVCRSGARAYTAAQIMKKAGFKKPLVMDGGMLAWNRFKS
ncbi:MAG: MBL fold metallo-hydrolase [Candidatus Heimdallarchaeota archaeon]|nr:MBL fold metallo-hydrolase [Candidatus Heimdallarchaeota archaeon]